MMQVLTSLRKSAAVMWNGIASLSDVFSHQQNVTDTGEGLLVLEIRYKAHDRAIHNLESYLINQVLGSQTNSREHLRAYQDDLVDLKKKFVEQGKIGHLHADIWALKKYMDNLNKLMISCFLTANASKPSSQEKHMTKPYQVAVICKEARCLADEVTQLREE